MKTALLASVENWRTSQDRCPLSPLKNAFPRVHLIGCWTASSPMVLSHSCAPGLGNSSEKMTDAQINNEQWSHAEVITFPELFLVGVITRIPGEVYPSHFATKESCTHPSSWQQFVDVGLGSRTFTRLLRNKCLGYKRLQKQYRFVISFQIIHFIP